MLTSTAIQEIEKATGIVGLQDLIKSEEEKDVVLTKTKHFDEVSYNVLHKNLTEQGLTPEKYEEAKRAGEEMAVKAIKRDSSYEFEGKSVKSLVDFINANNDKAAETSISEREKEVQKDNDFLKGRLVERETEIANLNKSWDSDKINSTINGEFSRLRERIEVPVHIKDEEQQKLYVENEYQKNLLFFKTKYNFERQNDKVIGKGLNGEVIKDDMANPVTIDSLVNKYEDDSFMNLKQEIRGRGEGDRYSSQQMAGIQTVEQLKEYAKTKGIRENTGEFDALYIEFEKNKT